MTVFCMSKEVLEFTRCIMKENKFKKFSNMSTDWQQVIKLKEYICQGKSLFFPNAVPNLNF